MNLLKCAALCASLLMPTQAMTAATAEALFALRDASEPGECVPAADLPIAGIASTRLNDGATLHVVPCRATVADVMSLLIIEQGEVLRVLSFPDPGFRMGDDGQGARIDRMGVTRQLSSLQVRADGQVVTGNRIPPGLGDGYIVQTYALEDSSPVLSRFAIERQGHPAITLWPLP